MVSYNLGEKLMSDKPWNGSERRSTPNDHDHITRMLVIQEGLLESNKELAETTKAIGIELMQHRIDDDTKFGQLHGKLNWMIGIGVGASFVIGLIVEIHK